MSIIDLTIPPQSIETSVLLENYSRLSYPTYVLLRQAYNFPEKITDPHSFAVHLSLLTRPVFFVGYERDEQFSVEICKYLKEIGTSFSLMPTRQLVVQDPSDIVLLHHYRGQKKNTWYFKAAYLLNWYQFDRCGYSGWSEAITNTLSFNASERDFHFLADLKEKYITKGLSKYSQTDQPFKCAFNKFLLLILQMDGDTVQQHCYFDNYWDIVEQVILTCINNQIPIVIKRHPHCQSTKFDPIYNKYSTDKFVRFTNGSIYQLLQHATSVCTMNSGVGFEALLLDKKVFSFGQSEYSLLTESIKTEDDLSKLLNFNQTELNLNTQREGLLRLLMRFQIDSNNPDSFYRALVRCMALREIQNQGWPDPQE